MNETMKNIGLVIAGVIVGILFSVMLMGGDNSGGVYSTSVQDFSEGISVDQTVVIDGDGNVDAPITSSTGTFSGTVSVGGVLSATAESNKIGSINTYNPIYIGAGDGCTAMLYAASTTLVSSATTTSFCNP